MKRIDFSAVASGQTSFAELSRETSHSDLRLIIADLFETLEAVIAQATDDNVVFVPEDPQSTEEDHRGWTLGHIIAHLTASLEETSAVAATLARGVLVEQRLRYEVPWETIKTAQQVRARLSESHRIVNALLDVWPDEPHLDVTQAGIPSLGPLNATGYALIGVWHGHLHLDQLRETIRQAKEA